MDTVKVFDTWVEAGGKMLHFDVMTTDEAMALKLANEYVIALGHTAVKVTAQECRFCHEEPLVIFSEKQQLDFRKTGGFIVLLPA